MPLFLPCNCASNIHFDGASENIIISNNRLSLGLFSFSQSTSIFVTELCQSVCVAAPGFIASDSQKVFANSLVEVSHEEYSVSLLIGERGIYTHKGDKIGPVAAVITLVFNILAHLM